MISCNLSNPTPDLRDELATSEDPIFALCGENNRNKEVEDIVDNPNFVFESDPNYTSVFLFDAEGNAVIVNSWEECRHYVVGNWIYKEKSSDMILYLYFLIILVFVVFIYKKLNFK